MLGPGGCFDRRSLLCGLFGHSFSLGRRFSGCFLDRLGNHGLGVFLFRLGLLGRRGSLRRALLGAFLGLFARLRLLRVVARRPLADAGCIEEAQHAIRWLGADTQPVRYALDVELHPLGRILRQQGVVGAELLDEAAVARVAAVGDDDAVIGPLLGAAPGEANC